MSLWIDNFLCFFRQRSKEIGVVLYAEGCREGWLQGEFYRLADDQNFAVNCSIDNFSGKIDLYGEYPNGDSHFQKMVAEIKIISPSFLTKNINGYANIDEFVSKDGVQVTDSHLENINKETGSLLKDVKRLRSISSGEYEKYMILVIPMYEELEQIGSLKNVLETIRLSNQEYTWERRYPDDHFDVRIWRIE